MVTLNDYLYSGDTMFKILKNYSQDLKKEAKCTGNEIDLMHANFLLQIRELLEHNDSLLPSPRRSGNFINIWLMNIRFLRLHLKEGSNR